MTVQEIDWDGDGGEEEGRTNMIHELYGPLVPSSPKRLDTEKSCNMAFDLRETAILTITFASRAVIWQQGV